MRRRDLYLRPHKALRAMMADTMVALGSVDPADECEVREGHARLEELLAFCEKHALIENAFVHRALEERREGASAALAGDHVGHFAAIAQLREAAKARDAQLYRRVATFVAENLEHMEREERDGNALLRSLFSDAELDALEVRILASIPPDQAMHTLRWMLPALNHAERVAFFAGLAHAPSAVREAAFAVARTHLPSSAFARLEGALAQREPATLES
jgi:hypothetical protein